MATAKTCVLVCGAVTATLRSPLYPEKPGARANQILGRTWGGAFQVCDLGPAGVDQEELMLEFRDLTRQEYTDLRDLVIASGWGAAAITYTDPWEDDHTNMHYVSGIAEAQASKGDRWALTLVLAKDMEA
jgi:hypothetical protein